MQTTKEYFKICVRFVAWIVFFFTLVGIFYQPAELISDQITASWAATSMSILALAVVMSLAVLYSVKVTDPQREIQTLPPNQSKDILGLIVLALICGLVLSWGL